MRPAPLSRRSSRCQCPQNRATLLLRELRTPVRSRTPSPTSHSDQGVAERLQGWLNLACLLQFWIRPDIAESFQYRDSTPLSETTSRRFSGSIAGCRFDCIGCDSTTCVPESTPLGSLLSRETASEWPNLRRNARRLPHHPNG